MADTIFPTGLRPGPGLPGAFLGAPDVAPPHPSQSEAVRERLDRLRRRFLAYWAHPFWERWRREAAEDQAFATGQQWDEGIRRRLAAQERSVLTINEIRPVVEVLTGYERGSRLQLRPIPEGREDLADVTVLGRLLKRVQADADVDWTQSEGFREGLVTGLAVYYCGISYEHDPIHGRPELQKVRMGEVIWDPDWQRYDLSDARGIFWHKMVPIETLIAAYPEHEEVLRDAVEVYAATADRLRESVVRAPDPRDAYRRDSLDSLALYDELADEVRVVEAWEPTWETLWVLVDKREERVEELPDDPQVRAVARKLADLDPDVRVVRQQRRRWTMSIFLPAIGLELETGHPFENDLENHPFIPYIAYREGEDLFGIVRNLKDPQREINRRRSALADIVARHGAIRWYAYRAGMENPEDLETAKGSGFVYWLRGNPQTTPPPREVAPPSVPNWIWQLQSVAKMEIREISGINADLLGEKGTDASGIAIARRQQQGQVIATSLFDNHKRSRRLIGQRLCKRIQQVYTREMTIRLDLGAAGTDFVTLNARRVDPGTGRITVTNNVPDLRYDVTFADAPETPSARMQALQMLLEITQRMPQIAPALADVMIELSDLPNREEVLARVRALLEKQGLIPGAAPPGPTGPTTGARPPAGPPAGGLVRPGLGGQPGPAEAGAPGPVRDTAGLRAARGL